MDELLNLQKKYNITDKDLYILSKLEDDKRKSSFIEKEKFNAMQRSIISKYKMGFTDKVNIFKILKKSTFHNNTELIEKYKDSEKAEELNIAGQNGKQSFVLVVSVIVVIFIAFSLSNNKKSNNNSSYENSSTTTQNPCSDMESYNQGVKEGRLQRGVLTDCDTYYPYEGWANNKECWCEGFNKGKNE